MKKIVSLLCFVLILVSFTGCQKQEQKTQNLDQKFIDEIQSSPWSANIMGTSGTVEFGNGTGTATVEGYGRHTFDYTVSDVSDDGKSATVTITNTGIEQIDGQSVSVKVVDDGLEVSYLGMSYTLTPTK